MLPRQRFNVEERKIIAHAIDVEVRHGNRWYRARIMTDGVHGDFFGRSFINVILSNGPHAGDYFRVYPGHIRLLEELAS